MPKFAKIYKAQKSKLNLPEVSLNDLDYLSESSSLENIFKINENDLQVLKLIKARGQILTEKQDTILEMYFKGRLSISQIAKEFKTSRQNVHAQYYMAIKKLRRYFNDNK